MIYFYLKFETWFDEAIKIQKEETKKKKKTMSNTQFAQNVYEFQMEVFDQLLKKFDGKVVGSDEFNLDSLKEEFFEGYTPGDTVKGAKGKAKKEPKEKKEKKQRPLSGYIFFGQQNKPAFTKEMNAMDEKPKYVVYIAEKWNKLSGDEKGEWNEKAKASFEEGQKEQKEKVEQKEQKEQKVLKEQE